MSASLVPGRGVPAAAASACSRLKVSSYSASSMRESPPVVAVLICCPVVVIFCLLVVLWHYILSKLEKVFQFFPSFIRRWFIMKFFYCHEKIEIFFLEFTGG